MQLMTRQDEELAAAWHRLKPERERRGQLRVGLSWLRKYPIAFATVCEDDPNAAAIAVTNGWPTGPMPLPTDAEIAAVELASAAARAHLKATSR